MKSKIISTIVAIFLMFNLGGAQMLANITEDVSTEFGVYHPRAVQFTPAVPEYTVQPDFSNVDNFGDFQTHFQFNEKELDFLRRNHFVVRHGNYMQLYDVYNAATFSGTPVFVTSDAVLHIYHVLYDNILAQIEEQYFIQILDDLTMSLWTKSNDLYLRTNNSLLREAALHNWAYFHVAASLLGHDFIAIPTPVDSLVVSEMALIDKHEGFAYSPIFGDFSQIDYSQFVPRGHYTRNEMLSSYFKAMMWYGLMPFTMEAELFGELSARHTLQALLLTHMICSDAEDYQRWATIYNPTSFFACRADDPTLRDYLQIAKQIYGADLLTLPADSLADPTLLNAFMIEAQKLPAPAIPIYISGTFTPYKGFRFMGQRQIPDSYMFAHLVFPDVSNRLMPMGLDVMSILGSQRAGQLADSLYKQTDYPGYAGQIVKFNTEFSAKAPAEWAQNLYWNWLYCLMPLLYEKESGFPFFMQITAWTNKELLAALASWAELRHDTILYAKQSQSGWTGEPGPDPPHMVKSYVEANPYLYARLFSLAQFTRDGLSQQNLLSDFHAQKLGRYIDLLDFLTQISIKELQNESLTTAEYDTIFSFGGIMESLVNFKENLQPWDKKDVDNMAVVADVHTDPNYMRCLEEGVGYPLDIYVIVHDNVALRLTHGAIFSYYEFAQPIANRMTDEQWRSFLSSFSEPALPAWTTAFMDSSLKRKSLIEESPQNYFTAIEDDETRGMVNELRLLQNYPNPFNPQTVISYKLSVVSQIKITIYDIQGSKIKELINAIKPAGSHFVTWNSMNEEGEPVSSGVYLYQLEVDGKAVGFKKMMLIK